MKKHIGGALMGFALLGATAWPGTVAAHSDDATCGGVVGEVHGHHVFADYVTGDGHDELAWPPAGEANAAGGAAVPGGPGPGFHFQQDPPVAPGASFCIEQAQSPGFHVGD